MKDRFKFRFWNNKKIIYDDLPHLELYNCEDYIWMQCTGLKDKNGKLIYEGDILADATHKYIVEWSLNNGYFIRKPWICDVFSYRIDPDTTKNTKVIGNIYENPELLEE